MLEHWLWLAHRPGINEHTKVLLLQYFHTPEAVFAASREALTEFPGINPATMKALQDKALELYENALKKCSREGIRVITYWDEGYPRRLKNIYDPPLVLYYKGEFPSFDGVPVIGVVGTRKCSAYGASAAGRLGREISSCGGLVVSGLAEGIDAAAMEAALQAGYPTVGVLGTGADVIYPKTNGDLFRRVERNGCILSELLPGTQPFKWNFPRRNRLISGLSVGVAVVEAPERSGALYTARAAMDQGRDVFAVPGNIDLPSFAGSNSLLREGALPVSCGWDIMGEYTALFPDKIRRVRSQPEEKKAEPRKTQPPKRRESTPAAGKKDIDKKPPAAYSDLNTKLQSLPEQERAIAECLRGGERLTDDVIAATGIPSGQFLRLLTMLELKGLVTRLPGNRLALKEK